MSNDGRSIGDHLREIEESASRDSSADSSATRQPEHEPQGGGSVTNRAASERESKPRVPQKRQQG
jgi:hypothetical protein